MHERLQAYLHLYTHVHTAPSTQEMSDKIDSGNIDSEEGKQVAR